MTSASSSSNSSAFSFISKGWREVHDSADTDIQLMCPRANTFKNLATSLDQELENFFNSATTSFSVPPKLLEFWWVYLSPNFSKKVLEKWTPRSQLRIDLLAIRNAIVVEVEDGDGVVDFNRVRKSCL
ncbi:digalactosyldiacylglycerol synthase 1 [Quercus suber]|uniref:Digalactosyldiacylglycerol synthase 1 n=1 Tax=Quercus suber TaxID=58331 RepID=A0AAW0LJ77_QUESU